MHCSIVLKVKWDGISEWCYEKEIIFFLSQQGSIDLYDVYIKHSTEPFLNIIIYFLCNSEIDYSLKCKYMFFSFLFFF